MDTERRAEVEPRRAAELARPAARRPGPVAVYDTVTEGMTGRQFLRTRRWFALIASAFVFAIACGFLANWQFDRGQQATADNAIVAANFSADPVPIEQALPTLVSYDPGQSWQRVSVTGVYQQADELVVRNRSNAGANGFEVLTPLQLGDGSVFLVDRGWVAPASDDALAPGTIPAPATGRVDVAVQLRPSEAPLGAAVPDGNQITSITLPRVQQVIGGEVYTGAYGVLTGQNPAAAAGLAPIQTTMPTEDVGTHYSYTLQWLFFGVLGFVALGLGIRSEFRKLNSDDPEERERAASRQRKAAKKPFTDEELEDEEIDGFLPLTRWGIAGGAVSATTPRTALPGKQADPPATPPTAPPDVYVIEAAPQSVPDAEPDDR
ncbi:hypothetical protein B7R54_08450 [Subtercola boreus]|uniref:SURF1-like protein n=1 Tax=Subtercola boreus TaxID=120213 RepID=A0A3E0VH27_9MICO|nr:SURF1 family protein [Subtercola boreus]RFA09252.1 hypothetical protein B7R54_08450 [Subtercola boreus]TQL53720.1 cytochrome oxidase assembly protein ShyY1 [Subtercola boreus]